MVEYSNHVLGFLGPYSTHMLILVQGEPTRSFDGPWNKPSSCGFRPRTGGHFQEINKSEMNILQKSGDVWVMLGKGDVPAERIENTRTVCLRIFLFGLIRSGQLFKVCGGVLSLSVYPDTLAFFSRRFGHRPVEKSPTVEPEWKAWPISGASNRP